MWNVKIAIAGKSRCGDESESGNVRMVHGCLRMRTSFGRCCGNRVSQRYENPTAQPTSHTH
jgi:hypothetical protein